MNSHNLNERPLIERERALFKDISGGDSLGHAKAHVVLKYFIQFSNGATQDIELLNITNPYISVFKHAGFVTVSLDFHLKEDADLRMFFNLMANYSSASNSVSYTTKELLNGYYMDNGVKKPVYFPMIHLVLSPIGKESQYQMVGINPVLWNLSPKSPTELDPCVLQFAFKENFFVVTENPEQLDLNDIQAEIISGNSCADPSLVCKVRNLCHSYGLYGNVIYHHPSSFADSDLNRIYIVAGYHPEIEADPLPPALQPDDIIRKMERNKKIFHTGAWAYDLSENSDSMQAIQELDLYCSMAAFVKEIYAEYDLPAPEKIRYFRINQLNDFFKGSFDPKLSVKMHDVFQEGLDEYFKSEKTRTPFQKQWHDYFLSDRFPDDDGPIGRIMGFLNRNSNVISLEQLMDVNGDVKTLHMEEHEYRAFAKFMKDVYPDVLYAISEMEVVDHGIPKPSQRNTEAFGTLVTGEDFAVILKERFADEGYEAIQNLKPMYWEYRDVHYKEVDEPLIARAYNSIRLAYAKPNDLMDLTERGPVCLKKIPYADFMNFVSLAKANKLRFYIDNRGEYAVPSLKTVNVLFNEHQKEKMHAITNRLINEKGSE